MKTSRWLIALVVVIALSPVAAQRADDVASRVQASSDVVWLEQLVSQPGTAEAAVSRGYMPKALRQAAYVRLGAVGSAESIAAIRRIEDQARRRSLIPATFALGRYTNPSGHFGDWTHSLAGSIAAENGTTFGVLRAAFMGGDDLMLTSTRTPDDPASWSRPLLIPNARVAMATMSDAALTWEGPGRLLFRYTAPAARAIDPLSRVVPVPITGPQEVHIVIQDVRRDSDGDGWTDVEERRLRLRPNAADSDGDGMPDGVDVSPQYAPSATESNDVEAAILSRAIFAGYGLFGSHAVMLGNGNSRPLQLWGLSGPVLFGVDRAEWIATFGSGPPLMNWKLTSLTDTDAVVKIGDFEGGLAAAGYTARLRKIGGEWIVMSYTMDWIS